MRKFFYIFIALGLVALVGCESKTTSTVASSLAQLSTFSFAKNDSMPGLAKAFFTIEERLDTGLVWNQDSMLFGTRLDSVVPRCTFAATPGAAFFTFPDTIRRLTGYDTLDFTKSPIYLTIRSADNSNTKTYEIRATVHKVDPDLYTWTQLTEAIYPLDDSEQRVVELMDDFVMIVSNGFELHVYHSADGANWNDLGTPIGLPAGTKVRQIISDGSTLYYGQENKIYTSIDGVHWIPDDVTYPVITMLLYWNGEVWALVENNGYELATYSDLDGSLQLSGLRPDEFFPISDFATVTFQSASWRERAMIIGGFSEDGAALNTRWNLEYSVHIKENNGYRLEEYSIDRPDFKNLTGISVISYNDQLLLFGGVDERMSYLGRDILISKNEGLTWEKADTTKNRLPDVYQARQKQTAIVRDSYIYLFGGQDAERTYSDVYKGHLNSIDWNK